MELVDKQRLQQYQEKFFSGEQLQEYNRESEPVLAAVFQRADLLLADKIIYTDAMDMEACDRPYSLTAFKWNRMPETDPEWVYMLSRHGFLVDLGLAYHLTQDRRYFEKWRELVLDFIQENGQPTEQNPRSWRPIDTGIRLTNWLKSMTYFPVGEWLTSSEWALIEESLLIHFNYLKTSFVDKFRLSNWGVLAVSGMAALALFSKNPQIEAEKPWIWQRLREQLVLQFYEDGVHWEQSPLYQHEVIMCYLYLLQLSEYLEIGLPLDLRARLKKPIEAVYYQADEQDVLNPINDSDHVDFGYIYAIYRYMGFLPMEKRQPLALLYIGQRYRHPEPLTSQLSPLFTGSASGLMAIKEPDRYFTLFNGFHGSSHGHATTGSFTYRLSGEDVVIDSGRFTYTETALRQELKTEAAHNSLIVQDNPATEITGSWSYAKLPLPLHHTLKKITGGYYAECSWQGTSQGGQLMTFHRRFILLDEPEVMIICDSVQGMAEGTLLATLNIAPEIECKKVNETTFQLQTAKQTVHYWLNQGKLTSQLAVHSEIYNQQAKHQRIVAELPITAGLGTQIAVLTAEKGLTIKPVAIYQNNGSEPLAEAVGIQLQTATGESTRVYCTFSDMVAGNKLLVSESGDYFYGQVVLVTENQEVRRIK